jgi:cytochrome c oxidase assembly protein subunit 11
MPATRPAGNTVLAIGLIGVVAGMTGLAYASVPLYRLFCQVTGYGGTTQVAAAAPGASEARMITVRFDATVSPSLPWRFEPSARAVEVAVGEERLAYFRATNRSDRPATGMATFNVTPHKAGLYFKKIACFCFDRQVLEPGESVEMPVSFYVDPEIAGDANLDEVKTITLSYTFFAAVGEDAATDQRGLAKLSN